MSSEKERVVTLKSDAIHGQDDSSFMDSWLCSTVATSPSRKGRPASHRPKIKVIKDEEDKWANYILGVIDEINRELELIECPPLQSCDIYVHSLVPTGCGVASSAALEVATACMFRELFPQVRKLSDKTIVNLCRRAEQNFVGTMCGIMDQLTSYFGRKDECLCLDFATCGEHEYHPFAFGDDVGLVLASIDAPPNDPVCKHEIDRLRKKVEDCKNILRQAIPGKQNSLTHLRSVTIAELDEHGSKIPRHMAGCIRHVSFSFFHSNFKSNRLNFQVTNIQVIIN